MSRFTLEDGKLTYSSPKFHRVSPNPAYRNWMADDDGDDTSVSSQADSVRQHQKALQQKMLQMDIVSFVSGSARQSLQLAHICNAVRNDPLRKAEVEDVLSAMRCTDRHFDLDGAQNLILLEADLHIPWARNAAFVLVPEFSVLEWILRLLRTCNTAWQAACADANLPNDRTGPADPFPLVETMRPLSWRLIVLQPAALLALNQPLVLLSQEARKRILDSHGNYTPSIDDWQYWVMHPFDPILVPRDPQHDHEKELLLCDHPSRAAEDAISVFAMLLNAHARFTHYIQTRQSGTSYLACRRRTGVDIGSDFEPDGLILRHAQIIGEIVEALCFKPEGFEWPFLEQRSSTPQSPSSDSSGGGASEGSSAAENDSYDDDGHDGQDSGPEGESSADPRNPISSPSDVLPPSSPTISHSPSALPSPITTSPHYIACPTVTSVADFSDDHSPIGGESSEALEYLQPSAQVTNVLLDDPEQPAVPPEEEVDGFTDTEWEILKTQLNSNDPAVSRNALIMMTCNTRFT